MKRRCGFGLYELLGISRREWITAIVRLLIPELINCLISIEAIQESNLLWGKRFFKRLARAANLHFELTDNMLYANAKRVPVQASPH